MASWWRQYADAIGAPATRKAWRTVAIDFLGIPRTDLAGSGGWDRRVAAYFDRMEGTGPWARHLVMGDSEPVITGGIVNDGVPVFHDGLRVVHNG